MRVAIVAGPDPARAFPAAALALGLSDNGDDVLMLTGRRWVGRLMQLGVPAEEAAGLSGEPGSVQELRYRRPGHAAEMTPATRDRLADWQPHLVVADVRTLTGGFAAEMLGLPWVQLHPHPLLFRGNPALLGSHRRQGRGGPPRSRERHSRPRVSRHTQREFAAARNTLDLPPVGPPPLMHMVATLPALEPPRPNWPSNASVVGPLIWDPAAREAPIPEGQSPLVMVSPPTGVASPVGLLQAALAGLRGMRMVATVLEPYDEPVPAWVSVGPGRQEPVLSQAAVVVTGGGHGSIVRALTAGVPLVLAPGDGELELARRVEQLGVAVVLRRLTPRSLRRAVERVIADRAYASAARHIARALASADPVVLCHQSLIARKAS